MVSLCNSNHVTNSTEKWCMRCLKVIFVFFTCANCQASWVSFMFPVNEHSIFYWPSLLGPPAPSERFSLYQPLPLDYQVCPVLVFTFTMKNISALFYLKSKTLWDWRSLVYLFVSCPAKRTVQNANVFSSLGCKWEGPCQCSQRGNWTHKGPHLFILLKRISILRIRCWKVMFFGGQGSPKQNKNRL